MKRKPIVFVVLFFVILGLFAGLTFGLPATGFSANENRYLTQMPGLLRFPESVAFTAGDEELIHFGLMIEE